MCSAGGLGFATVIFSVTVVSDHIISMIMRMPACGSYGVYASSHWAITHTLAGPLAGRWSGVQNFSANLAGVIAPALTGFVIDRTSQFLWAFAVSAVIVLIGAGVYAFGLGSIRPVMWRTQAES